MAQDFSADLETMFDTGEIAEDATYTPAGGLAVSIDVHFGNAFAAIEGLGDVGVDSSSPQAVCKTSDVPNASRGDTLQVGAVTYHVVSSHPGNGGMTLLILSKDP